MKQVLEEPSVETAAKERDEKAAVPSKPSGPVDKLDRGVPRTAVAGFFRAVKENDYETAAAYLDLRNLPRGYRKSDGPELARHFKVILDRALWVEMDTLSTVPMGHTDDGLPSYRDFVGRITLKDDKVDVLLQRVPRGDDVYIWKFSSATVRNIPPLYEEFGYGKLGEMLYSNLPEFKFLTLQSWQWVVLLMLLLVAYVIVFVPTYLLGWLFRRKGSDLADLWALFITGPARWLLILLVVKEWIDILHPSIETRALI